MKYRIINSPYLLAQRQIKLEMVLGDVEGIIVTNIRSVTVMDRWFKLLIKKFLFLICNHAGNLKPFVSRRIRLREIFSLLEQTKVAFTSALHSYQINIQEYFESIKEPCQGWNFLHFLPKYF